MRRLAALLGAGVLAGTGLAACSSATQTYCSALKGDAKRIDRLAAQSDAHGGRGGEVLVQTLQIFRDLQADAPPDVRPDYDTLVTDEQNLLAALRASGVDPNRFQPGRRPPGISDGEYKSIQQAALALDAQPARHAAQHIEDHAQQICHVNLRG